MVIKLDDREILKGSSRPYPGQNFCDTNADVWCAFVANVAFVASDFIAA